MKNNPSIMICVPCFDKLDTAFVMAMEKMTRVGRVGVSYLPGSLVYAAREDLAREAVARKFDYTLWIDSDMVFQPDFMLKMLENDKDILCSLFFRRKPPYTPALYKKLRAGLKPEENEIEGYEDYPRDSVFEVDACGFAGVLVKTKVFEDVLNKYGSVFIPIPGFGEDISFCLRARNLGYKIYCDSRIKMGHISMSVVDENTYQALKAQKQ